MENIIRSTKELGKQIQANESYIAMAKAREAVDANDVLQKQIQEFTMLKMSLNQEISKEPRDDAKVAELDEQIRTLHKAVTESPAMLTYNDAKLAFDTVVEKVNQILSASLNGQDPETADAQSCGGSCSSCAGCH
ncbi:MAG: YlbF family regulator [Acetanaerobacterium sp.]